MPESTLTAQLDELHQALVAANARVRETELAHNAVKRQVAELGEDIIDAHADQDTARASKLSKERAKLEQGALREAEERAEGAARAVQRAEAEKGLFAHQNMAGLMREMRPAAEAAVQAAEDAFEGLARAQAQWQGVWASAMRTLQVGSHSTAGLPRYPQVLNDLIRESKRLGSVQVPLPLPHEFEKDYADSSEPAGAPGNDPKPDPLTRRNPDPGWVDAA